MEEDPRRHIPATDPARGPNARAFRHLAGLLAGVLAVASFSIVVWWPAYVQVGSSLVPDSLWTTPHTALALTLAALGIWLAALDPRSILGRIVSGAAGLSAAAIAGGGRADAAFGIPLRLDERILGDAAGALYGFLNSSSDPGSVPGIAVLAVALLLVDVEPRRGFRPAQFLALATILLAVQSIVGHSFGSRAVHDVAPWLDMPPDTAVLSMLLAVALLLARPTSGILSVVMSDTASGLLARRLIPAVFAVPMVLGIAGVAGFRAGLYDAEFGLVVLLTSLVAALSFLIWMSVRSVGRVELAARAAVIERERLAALERAADTRARIADRRFRHLVDGIDAIVWEIDAETRRFTFLSDRVEAILGHQAQSLIESPSFWLHEVIHPEDRDRVAAALTSPGAGDVEFRVLSADGRVVWLRTTAEAIEDRGGGGTARRLRGIMMDVTESRRAARRLDAQHAVTRVLAESESIVQAATRLLQVVGESLDWKVGSLFTVDPAGERLLCVEIWSSPGVHVPEFRAATFGRTHSLGVGLPGRVWQSGEPAWIPDIEEDMNFPRATVALREGLRAGFAFPIRLDETTLGVLEFFSEEIRPPDDDLLRMIGTVGGQIGQFIERKHAEAAVRQREEQLRFALDAAHTWTWDLDLRTDELTWSANVGDVFGIRSPEDIDRLLRSVHPDDETRIRAAWDAALRDRALYDVEYRLRAEDGRELWATLRGRAVYDEHGEPLHMLGVGTDVTGRKLIEAQLRGETEAVEVVNRIGQMLTGELDLRKLLQAVTDAATKLAGAGFGAFFYEAIDESGRSSALTALSGEAAASLRGLPTPRIAALFGTILGGDRTVRLADVRRDSRFAGRPPIPGFPDREPFVVSLLAASIVSRSGKILGGLFLGHSEPGAFGEREERLVASLAAQAGIAVDNARLYEAERRARQQAESSNRAKDEFLAMLGHELRNPIGAIASSVHALDNPAMPADRAPTLRAIIARQTQHLARLVDDLLDVSRLQSGKVVLRRQPIDLREVTERSFASFRAAGLTDRHDVTLDAESAWVDGDPTRLEQIVGNLFGNAVKYTPAGGRVHVEVRRDGPQAVLRVADTGRGIEPEMMPRIFDLFAQGEQTLDRSQGGLGIGLTLVRRLVELHDGTVEVSSPGSDGGSTFVVRLPLRPAPERTVHDPEHIPTGPCRILLVDDYADAREALRGLLEMWGHDVEVAMTGPEGVEKALAFRPDVAIVDIGLPGFDGYQVASRIRAGENGRRTYLIALTGYGQPEDRARALEADFDAHLVKPLDETRLSRILAGLRAN